MSKSSLANDFFVRYLNGGMQLEDDLLVNSSNEGGHVSVVLLTWFYCCVVIHHVSGESNRQ